MEEVAWADGVEKQRQQQQLWECMAASIACRSCSCSCSSPVRSHCDWVGSRTFGATRATSTALVNHSSRNGQRFHVSNAGHPCWLQPACQSLCAIEIASSHRHLAHWASSLRTGVPYHWFTDSIATTCSVCFALGTGPGRSAMLHCHATSTSTQRQPPHGP
jgi:hypothetical protein